MGNLNLSLILMFLGAMIFALHQVINDVKINCLNLILSGLVIVLLVVGGFLL